MSQPKISRRNALLTLAGGAATLTGIGYAAHRGRKEISPDMDEFTREAFEFIRPIYDSIEGITDQQKDNYAKNVAHLIAKYSEISTALGTTSSTASAGGGYLAAKADDFWISLATLFGTFVVTSRSHKLDSTQKFEIIAELTRNKLPENMHEYVIQEIEGTRAGRLGVSETTAVATGFGAGKITNAIHSKRREKQFAAAMEQLNSSSANDKIEPK